MSWLMGLLLTISGLGALANVHTTEVVEVKEVSDELVSHRIRCCGEEITDSWHTVSVHAADHDASLEEAKTRVQKTHEAKVAWRKKTGRA